MSHLNHWSKFVLNTQWYPNYYLTSSWNQTTKQRNPNLHFFNEFLLWLAIWQSEETLLFWTDKKFVFYFNCSNWEKFVDKCQIHSIFRFSFFGQNNKKSKKSAVIFRQSADFFIQKINKQDNWFFSFLVTLTKKRKMEWTGQKLGETRFVAWWFDPMSSLYNINTLLSSGDVLFRFCMHEEILDSFGD
jgi:hypothetical protein